MIRTLPKMIYGCALILIASLQTNAQLPDDPFPNGLPKQQTLIQKSSTKVSASLMQLYEGFTASANSATARVQSAAEEIPLKKYMLIKGDQVLVDVVVNEFTSETRTRLQKMGMKITGVFGRMVSGMVPIASMPLFKSAGLVKSVRPSLKRIHSMEMKPAFGNKGVKVVPTPVVSQGDTALRAYLARKYANVTGNGVKIGILSDSYNNLGGAAAGVRNGELPGPENPFNYKKPVQVLLDLDDSSGTDEGRMMAEIVHDLAPGAEIAFYAALDGEAAFAEGIMKLTEAGCNVIVDDVQYFDEPFYQDGIIAQAIDNVKKKGVAFFTAAGNSGSSAYESVYRPTTVSPLGVGNGTAHNFAGPGFAPVYFQPVTIPTNRYFLSIFQWDQPFFSAGGAANTIDMDIYLVNSAGQVVSANYGYGFDDNIGTGDALELLYYPNTTRSTTFYIVIVKYAGPNPSRLKYINLGYQTFLPAPNIPGNAGATISGHANAAGAITTGAAYYFNTPAYHSDTPRIESYSSLGGLAILFDTKGNRIDPILRKKPDLTAVDGVNTSFSYYLNEDTKDDADTFPNFFGTSAAAPHAAAVAALMIEAQRLNGLTPDQIKGIMTSTAVDMDNPNFAGFEKGFDFATGTGLLKADAAVAAVKFPKVYIDNLSIKAVCSDNPLYTRNWIISNPNPFEVEVHWLLNGVLQQGTVTAGPGETTFTTQTVYFLNRPAPNVVVIDWNDNLGIPHFDYAGSTTAKCGQDAVTAANTEKVSDMVANAESLSNAGTVSIYPNPISKNFRVSLSLNSQPNADLSLYTLDGKLLLKKVVSSTGVTDIDATSYAPGMYILKVEQKNFNKTFKLVKR